RKLHVFAAELDALRIVERRLARLLDDLVELRIAPALPVARRLWLARGRHELRVPAVEEERQVGMAAPGLDAPRHHRLEIAGLPAVDHAALGDHGGSIDAELTPLLDDHRAGPRHHRSRLAFDHQ